MGARQSSEEETIALVANFSDEETTVAVDGEFAAAELLHTFTQAPAEPFCSHPRRRAGGHPPSLGLRHHFSELVRCLRCRRLGRAGRRVGHRLRVLALGRPSSRLQAQARGAAVR